MVFQITECYCCAQHQASSTGTTFCPIRYPCPCICCISADKKMKHKYRGVFETVTHSHSGWFSGYSCSDLITNNLWSALRPQPCALLWLLWTGVDLYLHSMCIFLVLCRLQSNSLLWLSVSRHHGCLKLGFWLWFHHVQLTQGQVEWEQGWTRSAEKRPSDKAMNSWSVMMTHISTKTF